MCTRLITFTALTMFASVTVVFAQERPVHSSPCICDNWIRGLCEKANKATLCGYEALKAGKCWMSDEFLHYPKNHTCRELVKLLKQWSPADCGPDNTAKRRKPIVSKAAQQGAPANASAKLSLDQKNRNPATAVGPIPTKLTERVQLWRKQVLFCNNHRNIVPQSAGAFPTKEPGELGPRTLKPEPCNDGDMLLFNGLLCAAGEQVGATQSEIRRTRVTNGGDRPGFSENTSIRRPNRI